MLSSATLHYKNSIALLCSALLTALFLFAPLYYQPNLGGIGLNLTFNIAVWGVASFLIGTGIYLIAATQRFIRPINTWAYLVFPVVIILSGIIAASSQPIPWFFRQIYVIGGILFLFALFQFNIKQQQIERTLYVVVASTFINTLMAIIQIFSPELIQGWMATYNNHPVGVFQQVNVLSSYLATSIIISFYLISRPSINSAAITTKAFLITHIGSSAFIITYIGSRSGVLSAAIGILILFISRRQQLTKKAMLTLIALGALLGGAIPGGTIEGGFKQLSQKSIDATKGTGSSARIGIYSVTLELIAQKPGAGHGIGNFQRVWNLQASDYYLRNPDTKLPFDVEHPHNELAYWLIEGGIISVAGIVIAFGAIILTLIRCGLNRGGSYTALLTPITIHAQVEQPFYLSSLHWFLWLFLIFLALRHRTINSTVPLSLAATRAIKVSAILGCIGSSYFLIHTARAQADIHAYKTKQENRAPYLQVALNNLYFKSYAEELAMRNMLYSSRLDKNTEQVHRFIQWAEQRNNINPNFFIFQDLVNAYGFLGLKDERCKTIHAVAMLQPTNERLKTADYACKNSK